MIFLYGKKIINRYTVMSAISGMLLAGVGLFIRYDGFSLLRFKKLLCNTKNLHYEERCLKLDLESYLHGKRIYLNYHLVFYYKGIRHGAEVIWGENQDAIFFWRNGRNEGPDIAWYKNGILKSHAFRKNGKYHGKMLYWYDNGNPKVEAYAINDRRYGACIEFDRNGTVQKVSWREHGKKVTEAQFKSKYPGKWKKHKERLLSLMPASSLPHPPLPSAGVKAENDTAAEQGNKPERAGD